MTRTERKAETQRENREKARNLRLVLVEEWAVKMNGNGLPAIGDKQRKAACGESLELFAQTYLPHVFNLPMSDGQRADFQTMQTVILKGRRYAFASPRGDGKTSRVEAAILWAALYGYRRCIVIVGADLTAAQEIADSVKLELRLNEMLREDFPVPCWAAALSDGTALKAKQWTWDGERLQMVWGVKRIVLPVLEHSDGSGCVIVPRGLTGRLRGMRIKVGKSAVRPDLYAIDDPQTDESAQSPAQVAGREKLVLGAIMGSSGPGKTIAAMLPCTVIEYDDLAARMLDKKRHPDWQGTSRAMVKVWPKRQQDLWGEYMTLRREDSQEAANRFYADNREVMDEGAEVDWPERYEPEAGEISALQHAENLRCDLGDEVFAAEYQNKPEEKNPSAYDLTADLVASRVHPGRKRRELPEGARVIVAATDLNHYGLHSVAIGFGNDQTGWVADYWRYDKKGQGLIPKDAPEPVAKQLMFAALETEGARIAALPLMRGDDSLHVGTWIIDAGYMPDVVRRYVEGPGRVLGVPIIPVRGYNSERYRPHGKYVIGQPREQCHLTETNVAGRFVAFNACYWREVGQKAWLAGPNAPCSLSLFEGLHREFAEQIVREKLVEKLRGQFGFVWRWHTAPGWHDYCDCVTMAYVGAAWNGIGTAGAQAVKRKPKRRKRVRHIPV